MQLNIDQKCSSKWKEVKGLDGTLRKPERTQGNVKNSRKLGETQLDSKLLMETLLYRSEPQRTDKDS